MMHSVKRFRDVVMVGLFVLSAVFFAGNSWAKDRDLEFAAGASSATVKNAVIRGESDGYRVRAKAGQTLILRVTSLEDNAVFQVYLPGQKEKTLPGAGEEDDAKSWQGKLPQTGVYRIVVGGTRGNAEYTLRVEIKN